MGASFSYGQTQRVTENNNAAASTVVAVVDAPGRGGSDVSSPSQSILDPPQTPGLEWGRGGSNVSSPSQSILDPPQAPDLERNKRKKVKKMVEHVIDGGDLDLVLSYENDEECLLNESMLEDQETFRHQIENLGYAFIHVMREVILTDDEDQEEGEIVTYAEEEDDIVTDDDDEDD
ncbi:hypothetical protein OsI_36795 [Oryza sativa Indica Group]|uniref:Uncharacterized protein n=1 Tax=Oryza sativa subsp. indica TaxID=39946 RepID=A2ZG92_ORYSI|nr:hypothetical protein OsI_36795 [Oryza sativa Indica Group]